MKLTKRAVFLASLIPALVIPSVDTQAATFNLINLGGAEKGTAAYAGFYIATQYWASVLTDPVTINLDIGFSHLGANILGQTGSNSAVAYVPDIYSALAADATSALDAKAVSHLSPLGGDYGDSLTMRVNDFNNPPTHTGSPLDSIGVPNGGYTDTRTRLDNDQSANNFVLDVNTANLKALGFTRDANGTPLDPGAIDGSVVFSSDFKFDFNPTDGITAGESDFIGVAIHEIGHALGFVSGVDTYDLFTSPGSPQLTDANGNPIGITYEEALRLGLLQPGETNLENFAVGTPLDLFRYNSDGELDWSTSDERKTFSVDGKTPVYGRGAFSLGAFNGDGNQASHWLQPDQSSRASACGTFLGIMNPYLCSGQEAKVTGLDLAAFDAIGWDLAAGVRDNPDYLFTTADAYNEFASSVPGVPEPASWMEMIVGLGFIGGAMRKARRLRLALA